MASKTKSKTVVRSGGRKIRTLARGLAQTTLVAAAIAASQLSPSDASERESMMRVFDPGFLDRLHEPLSRVHE